jgi:capsular polysaccharide biosynthesis protein
MIFTFTNSLTNHAHWLMNSLLAVCYALPEIRGGSLILICPQLTDYRRGMLLKMGVPPAAILETDARYVTCRNLVFPSPLSTRANMQPSPSCLPMFRELRTHYARTYRQPMPEFVVYTRNGYRSSRSMVNENELIAALEALGFCCVAPHELSMEEEINVISRARIIVSQLGAALSNMPFAPAGCTIIEVGTDNYTSNEYLYIAHLLNQRFVRVMVEPLSEGFVSDSNIVRTILGS